MHKNEKMPGFLIKLVNTTCGYWLVIRQEASHSFKKQFNFFYRYDFQRIPKEI